MAVSSNFHFHQSFQNQSLRLTLVVFIPRTTIKFLLFHFQSCCELIFEGIQIFIEICTKFDCVTDPFSFRDLLPIPSCLIGTIDIWI